jgi:hypothetical protein
MSQTGSNLRLSQLHPLRPIILTNHRAWNYHWLTDWRNDWRNDRKSKCRNPSAHGLLDLKIFKYRGFEGKKTLFLINCTQYQRLLQNQKNYHIVSLMINIPSKISYRIINDKYFLENIISYHRWYFPTGKLSYRIVDDIYSFKDIISYHWW